MSNSLKVSTGPITDRATATLERSGIFESPYFQSLRSGEMGLTTFLSSQQQFYFAVSYFSRPMSALMMRIECPSKRLSILENIVEEHGGFNQSRFHETTFLAFLEQLGAKVHPSQVGMKPPVQAFNSSLMGVCSQGDLAVGIACLGVIEFAFATISSIIAQAVTDRNWVSVDKLYHYDLHAELDITHASEFFQLVDCEWADTTKHRYVAQGLELGTYLFDRLYRDISHDL